ncbi:MAG: efflux RND transporter permease subunit [Micrococcales bacterium]|nr:efflux RND transporter permease subunit [Micrococcales bacterium]MCL2666332.1 efflux RND transporter permease subunit [Micrococcales bacterium]
MFRLARLSLRNRAVVLLISLAIVLGGVVSMTSLKRELIPSMSFPIALVIATYPGVAADVVSVQVAEPVEAAIRGVQGVQSMNTTVSPSVSMTVVRFDYGTNMDVANQRLTTAVTRIATTLPDSADTTVFTGSMDELPVLALAVTSKDGNEVDPGKLAAAIDDIVVPRLKRLDNVRDVSVSGFAAQAVTITLDPEAMGAAGVDMQAVSDILTANGMTFPAGTVTEGDQTLTVQGNQPLDSVEALAALPLVSSTGQPVTLSDVAKVEQSADAATGYARLDGKTAVALSVTKTPAGNVVDVSHAVRDEVDSLRPQLDEANLELTIAFDQAPFIEESITGLSEEALIGLGFAVVIILVFLFSVRSTLVAACSIPLSVLVTFVVMKGTGETINIITLGGLAIAIGRIVDDSIVVIENIKRHLSYGEHKRDAIVGAVKEVGGAVAASTVTTVAVFLPIAFVGGMVGELFRPFGLTVAIAMFASLLVALTIVPVLAYWFVESPVHIDEEDLAHQREQAEAKERRGWWQRLYLPTLGYALRHPIFTLGAALLLLIGTGVLATTLETNFMDDSGQDAISVTQTFEPATSLTVMDDEATVVEAALRELKEVDTVQVSVGAANSMTAAFTGSNTATFSLTLASGADAASAERVVHRAVDGLGGPRTTEIEVTAGSGMSMGSSTVDLVVSATDPQDLAQAAQMVTNAVKRVDGVRQVTNNLAADQDTVAITVNREAAAAAGLTETQVLGMVSMAMTPHQIGTINTADGRLVVRTSMGAGPPTIEDLRNLPLAGPVTLGSLADVSITQNQVSITRSDGRRTATVQVTPESQDLGALSGKIQKVLDDLQNPDRPKDKRLPTGATVEIGGAIAMMNDAFNDMGLAMLVAIAIVFIVMVATFGSLLQPFILLISIPFAATGALLALVATGRPLGVPALIGMLMLVGIVVSNAIVLIDLINQYRRRGGRTLDEAITEGARKRLRPIVMTALATIFALLPMALGITGSGGFLSQPLAIVVIGGLLSSTFLTLVVVPVLYRYEARWHDRREARREERLATRRAEREKARAARLAEADA